MKKTANAYAIPWGFLLPPNRVAHWKAVRVGQLAGPHWPPHTRARRGASLGVASAADGERKREQPCAAATERAASAAKRSSDPHAQTGRQVDTTDPLPTGGR